MEIIAGTGVKFRIVKVPPMILQEIGKQAMKGKPKIPVVYLEDKDREEENPNDPDYLNALEAWEAETAIRGVDLAIMYGTEVETIPEGIPSVKDDSWIEVVNILDIEVPKNGKGRYLYWVKFCAAPDDLENIVTAVSRVIGVTEQDVADSAELFRGKTKRGGNRNTQRKTQRK